MRASTAVNFDPEVDEPVSGGAVAAHPEEDNLEVEAPSGGAMTSSSAPVPESDETEAGAAPVPESDKTEAGAAPAPECDRSEVGAVDIADRPAVAP